MGHQDIDSGTQDARMPAICLISENMSPDFLLPAALGTLAPKPRDRNSSRWQKRSGMLRMSLLFPLEQGDTLQVRHSSCI